MCSDFLEAKVSDKARAEKHFIYTALGFGFQIKDSGRRCLSGESECGGRSRALNVTLPGRVWFLRRQKCVFQNRTKRLKLKMKSSGQQ